MNEHDNPVGSQQQQRKIGVLSSSFAGHVEERRQTPSIPYASNLSGAQTTFRNVSDSRGQNPSLLDNKFASISSKNQAQKSAPVHRNAHPNHPDSSVMCHPANSMLDANQALQSAETDTPSSPQPSLHALNEPEIPPVGKSRKRHRTDRDKKLHAMYSRKNYYKTKQQYESLRATGYELRAENDELRAEGQKLESLMLLAQQIVLEQLPRTGQLTVAPEVWHTPFVPGLFPFNPSLPSVNHKASELVPNTSFNASSAVTGGTTTLTESASHKFTENALKHVALPLDCVERQSSLILDRPGASPGPLNTSMHPVGANKQTAAPSRRHVDLLVDIIDQVGTNRLVVGDTTKHKLLRLNAVGGIDLKPLLHSIVNNTRNIPMDVIEYLLESLLLAVLGRATLEHLLKCKQPEQASDGLLRPRVSPDELYLYLVSLNVALQHVEIVE